MFGSTDSDGATFGVSAMSLVSNVGYGRGYIRHTASHAIIKDPLSHCCWNKGDSSIDVGSWLVRTTVVPEPSTLAIFALGMIGLASRRFKKQS